MRTHEDVVNDDDDDDDNDDDGMQRFTKNSKRSEQSILAPDSQKFGSRSYKTSCIFNSPISIRVCELGRGCDGIGKVL